MKNFREEKMRGSTILRVCCVVAALFFGMGGCDWGSTNTSYRDIDFDLTGDYTLVAGETPWDDIFITQTGNRLDAQDSREIFWRGTVSPSGTGSWQVYLTTDNQKTKLTEWMRGRIWIHTTPLGITVKFEGIYTRSDDAETSWFEANAWYNPDQFAEEEEVVQ